MLYTNIKIYRIQKITFIEYKYNIALLKLVWKFFTISKIYFESSKRNNTSMCLSINELNYMDVIHRWNYLILLYDQHIQFLTT